MTKAKSETGYEKGMGKKEILEKLKSFKTNQGKIEYLYQILEKPNLVSLPTQNSIYSVLGDLYSKQSKLSVPDFEEKKYTLLSKYAYHKAGLKSFPHVSNELKDFAGDLSNKGNLSSMPGDETDLKKLFSAEEIYFVLGSSADEKKTWKEIGNLLLENPYSSPSLVAEAFKHAGLEDKGKKFLVKRGKEFSNSGKYEEAVKFLSEAEVLQDKNVSALKELALSYEMMGESVKSRDINRKIKQLEESRHQRSNNLEKSVLGLGAVAGFVFSLFFLSSNVTGNVIGNAGASSNNVAGIITLTASFLLAFLALRK